MTDMKLTAEQIAAAIVGIEVALENGGTGEGGLSFSPRDRHPHGSAPIRVVPLDGSNAFSLDIAPQGTTPIAALIEQELGKQAAPGVASARPGHTPSL